MKALDLFCGAGGSAMGLHQAGFDVIGIDINPELNYPFPWIAADAMPILKHLAKDGIGALRKYGLDPDGIDLIWASPPCQSFSAYRRKDPKRVGAKAKDLIAEVRRCLERIGLPYIIENVEAAPLKNAIRLCGSSFGLDVRRHRLFECSFSVKAPACNHALHVARGKRFPGATNRPTGRYTCEIGVYRIPLTTQREVMGINWMTLSELSQAIPPVYSKHLAERWKQTNQQRKKKRQMGMKPRKKRKPKQDDASDVPRVYSMLSCHTCGCIDDYAGGIRALLRQHKVPKKEWNNIWDGVEKWPKADADHDLHWFIGWFNGVAEGQACNLEDLVVL